MKRTKKIRRRRGPRSLFLSNPQPVNWRLVGGRPLLTNPDTEVPPTKGLTLEKMEHWQGIHDKLGEPSTYCPPRIGALLRWKQEVAAEQRGMITEEAYGVTLIKGEKQLDLFFMGIRYFFVETNHALGLQSRSIVYHSRARAYQLFDIYRKDNTRGIQWTETVTL